MLTQEDKDKIIDLRQQGLSLQAIHEKLGFAIETIRKVITEEKEKKAKELRKETFKKTDKGQTKEDAVSFDSMIDGTRYLSEVADYLIRTGQLKESDKIKWEKRVLELQQYVRIEVDDRIAKEIADTIAIRDEEWREFLKQKYVKKEKATELANTIEARDATIIELKNVILQKDELIQKNQQDISQIKASHQFEKQDLNNQIRNLIGENNLLQDENVRKQNYIENRLNVDVRQWQAKFAYEREILTGEKIKFDEYAKKRQKGLKELYFEADKKLKDVERREKELADKEDKFRRYKDEFDTEINQLFDMLHERKKAIEIREQNAKELEKSLLKQKDEMVEERKKIQLEWQRINKIKERQEKDEQRLQKWHKNLERIARLKKVSTPNIVSRKVKLIGLTGQGTNDQQQSVTLYPASSTDETTSKKFKHGQPEN